jgi:hypothetical protein
MAPAHAGGQCSDSITVGDRLFRREERDDSASFVGDLDAGCGIAVLCRAIRFQREHHALLDLGWMFERHHTRDDRPLMQRQAETVAELQAERGHLIRKAEVLRPRPHAADLVRAHPRLDQRDGVVDPLARFKVSGHWPANDLAIVAWMGAFVYIVLCSGGTKPKAAARRGGDCSLGPLRNHPASLRYRLQSVDQLSVPRHRLKWTVVCRVRLSTLPPGSLLIIDELETRFNVVVKL